MNYLDFLEKNVFSGRVENQSVLELGALNSKITNVIGRCNPNSIYTVDPESSGKPDFRGTANDFYAADHFTEPYDVVVCMGLLYHLHSPWHISNFVWTTVGINKVITPDLYGYCARDCYGYMILVLKLL